MTLSVVRKRKFESYGSRNNSSLAINAGKKLSKINGPRVAVFEVDGFDTHAAQGASDGAHADCLKDHDNIIKGLKASLGYNPDDDDFEKNIVIRVPRKIIEGIPSGPTLDMEDLGHGKPLTIKKIKAMIF